MSSWLSFSLFRVDLRARALLISTVSPKFNLRLATRSIFLYGRFCVYFPTASFPTEQEGYFNVLESCRCPPNLLNSNHIVSEHIHRKQINAKSALKYASKMRHEEAYRKEDRPDYTILWFDSEARKVHRGPQYTVDEQYNVPSFVGRNSYKP